MRTKEEILKEIMSISLNETMTYQQETIELQKILIECIIDLRNVIKDKQMGNGF
jgi:hypothetical protein